MQLNRNHTSSDSLVCEPLVLDGSDLSLQKFELAAKNELDFELTQDQSVLDRVEISRKLVDDAVREQQAIYGVTTGFGGMANAAVPAELADGLQKNLLHFLSAGVGQPIDSRHVRGAMLTRANMLLKGRSGIRLELIQRVIDYLKADAIPVVKEQGSIGASGDLVPLAVIARAITGQGSSVPVQFQGKSCNSDEVMNRLGYEPIELKAKEGLALVNGTSFSTAIGANALVEAKHLFVMALATQAIYLRSLLAHEEPFDSFVHQSKPHPGQIWVADNLESMLSQDAVPIEHKSHPVQDRYSIRCLPQYLGPIAEGIGRLHEVMETELNGVSDNPLVDVDQSRLVQSGNFLGQSVGIAMDDLRRYIALTAKHLDLQIALLVAPEFNGGLSASLKGNIDNPLNMGLKGLQISGNSIVPMLLHQANPLVEHFPTYAEQFNQNVNGLSWGSANLAWKSVSLFNDYLSISLLFAIQAADLRSKLLFGDYDGRRLLGSELEPIYCHVLDSIGCQPGGKSPFVFDDHDRCLENDVEQLSSALRQDVAFRKLIGPAVKSFDQHLGNG